MVPRTMADVLDSILQIGLVMGAAVEANRLVDQLRAQLRGIVAAVCQASHPRTLVLQGLKPFTLGGQWVPEMVQLAGGADSWLEPGACPLAPSWDAVRQHAPEVIVLCLDAPGSGCSLQDVCELAQQPGWWALPAVRQGLVFICPSAYFTTPGPRLVEGVQLLANLLHPELISSNLSSDDAVMRLALRGGQRCRPKMLASYFKPVKK
eukprot:jgi/Astpho2/4701/e_gw1.00067.491.1_t